jgi:hypothetical protein
VYKFVTVVYWCNYHNCGHYRPVCHLVHDVSETGCCLRLEVEPTQLDPIDRANLFLCLCLVRRQRLTLSRGPAEYILPEDGDRIPSPKPHVLNKIQDDRYFRLLLGYGLSSSGITCQGYHFNVNIFLIDVGLSFCSTLNTGNRTKSWT